VRHFLTVAVALSLMAPPCLAATATGAASATIVEPVAVGALQPMRFGTLTKPNQNSVVILSPAGALTLGGNVQSSGQHNAASFTITGEPNATVTVTVDPTFSLAGPNSTNVTVTTSNDAIGGGVHLDGSGVATVNVGGSLTLIQGQQSGFYGGSFTVTANYP
jgi:hypothetical protein